jgi:hypothetical protein
VNPACYFDKIPGPAGLGIDIPVNDYSRAIFGAPHRFEKYGTGSDRKFSDVDIRFNGVLLMSGVLNITSATPEKYSGWLQSNLGAMGEEQREKYLNDLAWKSGVTFVNSVPGYAQDDTDEYGLMTFRNTLFWDGIGRNIKDGDEEISAKTKEFRDNFGCVVNYPDGETGVKTTGDGCVVSPFLFLRYVIAEALRMNNWYIDRNDMVQEGIDLSLFKNLMVYNNFNLIDITFSTELRATETWDYDLDQNVDIIIYEIITSTWALTAMNYRDMVPRISMKDFLLSLQNYLNIVFVFRDNMKVDIIDREAIITSEAVDIDRYFLNEWVMGERKDLSLKFTSEYDENDSLFADEFHDLSDRRDDFIDPVETKAELDALTGMEVGNLCLVTSTNQVWEYRWKVVVENTDWIYNETEHDAVGWELVSKGEQPYFAGTGDEDEEIKTGACTFQRNDAGVYEVKQKGNIGRMRSLWRDYGLRIVNVTEMFHPGGLYFNGDSGLAAARWGKWSQFWRNRLEIEGEFDIPLNMLYYMINNITAKYKTAHGEFIISEMDVEFGMNMIGRTRIKGYKV